MEIKSKLKEIHIPEPKKRSNFIWGFLIGMGLQWILIGLIIYPSFPTLMWTVMHREEVKWSMDRYEMIQKASHVLYFEDEMKGVTIVKPQLSTFKGE